MSEIKFACPHCRQHIACDENYGGLQISCPACRGPMLVPEKPEAAAPWKATASTRALSAASFTARPAEEKDFGFWSEEKWRKHVGQLTSEGLTGIGGRWIFFVVLIAPAVLTLAVLTAGKLLRDSGLQSAILFFVFMLAIASARYCGGWLADRIGAGRFIATLFTLGVLFVNGFIVLFGCATVMSVKSMLGN